MSDTRVRATTLFLYNLLPPPLLLFRFLSLLYSPPSSMCVIRVSRPHPQPGSRDFHSSPHPRQPTFNYASRWLTAWISCAAFRTWLFRPAAAGDYNFVNNLFPRVRCHGRLLFFLNFPATATTGIPAVTVAHLALLAPSPPSQPFAREYVYNSIHLEGGYPLLSRAISHLLTVEISPSRALVNRSIKVVPDLSIFFSFFSSFSPFFLSSSIACCFPS